MSDAKEAIVKSLLHTLEVVVALGVGLFVVNLFREDADVIAALKDVLIAAIGAAGAIIPVFLAKFARESGSVPIADWINDR